MTPLAQRFYRDLTVPNRDRLAIDKAGLLDAGIEDLHCFELTAVAEAVNLTIESEMHDIVLACADIARNLFLPSPRTWLEYRHGEGRVTFETNVRTAVLIEKDAADQDSYLLSLICGDPLMTIRVGRFWTPSVLGAENAWRAQAFVTPGFNDTKTPRERQAMLNRFVAESLLFLDMINTPGLVGLKSNAPHRGFERALRKSGVGRYPLRAWSEVTIKAHSEEAGPGERETGLTGRKCLHFVRAHRRHFQDGRETIVTHHWRGDPALGLKRTRYRVVG